MSSPSSSLPFDNNFGSETPTPTHSFELDEPEYSVQFVSLDPILQEPEEEKSYALREPRRQNAIRIEDKEKREKELLNQIIVEADEYKVEFHQKRQVACETNKATNREKEKVFCASLEKFHAEAHKDYWKSIAELIPREVPTVEKRKGKEEQVKKQPSVVVVQGPKPGKPTDLGRMRQVLVKLKHKTPPHLKLSPIDDSKSDAPAASKAPAVAVA